MEEETYAAAMDDEEVYFQFDESSADIRALPKEQEVG
jgi:hypothetical protein